MTLWAIFNFLAITMTRLLETGQLSKGYTSRTACLPRTIRGRWRCVFISAVGCHSEPVNPLPQKRRRVSKCPGSLGVAGPRVRSMRLNGGQRGTAGRWAPSRQPAAVNRRRGKGPVLYRQAEFYLLLPILTPVSFSPPIQTLQISRRRGEKKNQYQ